MNKLDKFGGALSATVLKSRQELSETPSCCYGDDNDYDDNENDTDNVDDDDIVILYVIRVVQKI